MNREELLKLPKGKYLLTDDIANYKYVLVVDPKEYEYGIMVGSIYDYHYYNGSPFTPHTTIFYTDDEIEVDWSYSKLKVKKFNGITKMGGLGDSFDFWRSLRVLKMVGIYNKETIVADMKRFKINWWVNLSRYDKKTRRKNKNM